MDDTSKYLIHAAITADGVVERSDVVGAIFGQTEGLLGEELDLRDLQQSSKVGRIDVEITSEGGQSFGEVTVASSLDRVETAILAASLETITRVGPCRARVEVTGVEDVREAKRREVARRAKELLTEAFDEGLMSGDDIVDEVRESVRVADVSEYEGLPAGPRVADSDAVVVVEGRADVLTLLQYGIKNAIAVEGTDVPDAVAELTQSRTVTAFLDGDRGGKLIRKELAQVGDIDYVALAPEGQCVEDLERREVMGALREKVPYEQVEETDNEPADDDDLERVAASEYVEADERRDGAVEPELDESVEPSATRTEDAEEATVDASDVEIETVAADPVSSNGQSDTEPDAPETLRGHTREVIGEGSESVRLLDAAFEALEEGDADEAFAIVSETETVPTAVVVDAELDQRLVDVVAQHGIGHVIARSTGEFVKRPASVRVRTADQLLAPNEA